ncbi:MAG: riboflavin synthase [Dehalococcoidaceae bacterium]|nr:riboflavin synthase [Dehalococcoidaceae bacterium]
MFTGIVEETGTLERFNQNQMSFNASIVMAGMETGGSIAVNGVCLTVTSFDHNGFTVEIMPETLKRSNLSLLKPGDRVNLERPLQLSKPLGGHFVQGHIDGTGTIKSINPVNGATIITVSAPGNIMRYVVEKGFIAIDGISLTVVDCTSEEFKLSIVGHSFKNTTLGFKKPGQAVNIEVDILAKYIEKMLKPDQSNLTLEYLSEHGFTA